MRITKEDLIEHLGHDIVIAEYGNGDNYALECETCQEVITDSDLDEINITEVEEIPKHFFKNTYTVLEILRDEFVADKGTSDTLNNAHCIVQDSEREIFS